MKAICNNCADSSMCSRQILMIFHGLTNSETPSDAYLQNSCPDWQATKEVLINETCGSCFWLKHYIAGLEDCVIDPEVRERSRKLPPCHRWYPMEKITGGIRWEK